MIVIKVIATIEQSLLREFQIIKIHRHDERGRGGE